MSDEKQRPDAGHGTPEAIPEDVSPTVHMTAAKQKMADRIAEDVAKYAAMGASRESLKSRIQRLFHDAIVEAHMAGREYERGQRTNSDQTESARCIECGGDGYHKMSCTGRKQRAVDAAAERSTSATTRPDDAECIYCGAGPLTGPYACTHEDSDCLEYLRGMIDNGDLVQRASEAIPATENALRAAAEEVMAAQWKGEAEMGHALANLGVVLERPRCPDYPTNVERAKVIEEAAHWVCTMGPDIEGCSPVTAAKIASALLAWGSK